MPIIHFLPVEVGSAQIGQNNEIKEAAEADEDLSESFNVYKCPVYKTSERAGELSTTGQSTNFILSVDLPCGFPEYMSNVTKKSSKYTTTEEKDWTSLEEYNSTHWILRGTAMLTMLDQ